MQQPKVSVVIPCYHRVWQLEQCLESLATTEYDNYEVICVVDGDSPTTFTGRKDRVIVNGSHKGVARTVAAGWKEATGDILMEVDQDVIFSDPLWMQRLVWAWEDFPFLGLLAVPVCPVYDMDKIWRSDRVAVRKIKGVGLNGGAMSVSRRVFEELGYPWQGPEKVGGHDYEYSWRARHCGYKTGYLHSEGRIAKQLTDAPEDGKYRASVISQKRFNTTAMRKRIKSLQKGADHFVSFPG